MSFEPSRMWGKSLAWGAACCAAASLASAQPVPESLRRCASEKAEATRLACYDTEMARLIARSQPSMPSQPPASPTPVAPASAPPPPVMAATPEERFGASEIIRRKEIEQEKGNDLTELSARVTSVSQRIRGEWIVKLENGQVWQQKEQKSTFVVKEGELVTITPGKLGAFWLANEEGRRTRVKRVR